jgi:uncharacterized membrane protein
MLTKGSIIADGIFSFIFGLIILILSLINIKNWNINKLTTIMFILIGLIFIIQGIIRFVQSKDLDGETKETFRLINKKR